MLDSFDDAIEKRWIRPYYQAVVRAKSGRVCHEEALARWIDPEFGFLSPGEFIPILEEAGLLHKVDMHIVDCVLEDMKKKHKDGVPVVPVSFNISLRDLEKVNVTGEIIRRVDDAHVPHSYIQVEFTESAASEDPAQFKTEVNSLRAAGFEVWMDDFGSGYSALDVLQSIKFDLIKFDMSFMQKLDEGENGKIIHIADSKKAYYPSDQKHFPVSAAIAALKRSKIGLYMNRIHTKNDVICDETNIEYIKAALTSLLTVPK